MKYNPKSMKAEEFISHEEILATVEYANEHKNDIELIDEILKKAELRKGLSYREASVLLACDDKDKVKEGCAIVNEEFKDRGLIAEPANFNCPGQITVSGDTEAVDRAAEVLKSLGAKRCLPVKVSGPFHTSLMKPAGEALRERFETEQFGEMNIPVVFNSYGRAKNDDEKISDILVKQVQSSVYLDDSIKYMADQGVELFVEIGPGNTLSKFVQKTTPDIECIKVDKVEDIAILKEKLGL